MSAGRSSSSQCSGRDFVADRGCRMISALRTRVLCETCARRLEPSVTKLSKRVCMTAWLMDLSAGAPPWLLPVLLLLLSLTLAMLYKKSGTRRVKSSEGLVATPDSHQRRRPHKSPPRAPVANRYNRDRQHGPSRTADVLPVALSSRFDTMAENDNDGSDWKPNHDASNDEDNDFHMRAASTTRAL